MPLLWGDLYLLKSEENSMVEIEDKNGNLKAYETVAERVRKFREKHPISSGWRLLTEVSFPFDKTVLCRATIVDPNGQTIATGTAEEIRGLGYVNKISAVENAETSAIGRVLFAAGFGGGEFASADELLAAIKRQEEIAKEVEKTKGHGANGNGRKSSPDTGASGGGNGAQRAGGPTRSKTVALPSLPGITYERSGGNLVARESQKGATFTYKKQLSAAGFSYSLMDGAGKKCWWKAA